MLNFETPPLLAEARKDRAARIAAREQEQRERQEREFAERLEALNEFRNQFDISDEVRSFADNFGVNRPYVPIGPLAIVGTGRTGLQIYFRCQECGVPTRASSKAEVPGQWVNHEWQTSRYHLLDMLACTEEAWSVREVLCREHQPESEED